VIRLPRAAGDGASRTGRWLYALHLWTVFGIALSNVVLGILVLSAPWTSRRRRRLPEGSRPLLIALGLYLVALVAAIIASYEPRTSARALSEIFTVSSVPLGLLLVRGEREARWVVDGLGILAAILAGAGLAQFFLGYGDLQNRIRGPFSHYMTFSGVLLVSAVLLLARLCDPTVRRAWRLAAFGLITLAMLASYTRNVWVGLLVAVVALLAVRARRLLWLVPPALLLIALAAPGPLRHRISSIVDPSNTSNYDRICMAWAGLKMVAERPLFGIGPDMVRERYPIYRHPSAPRYWVPHLHDSFLELAAERGLVGLAAFVALMGASAVAAWRRLRSEGVRGPRADLYLGALLALLSFNLAGLFENNWGDTEVQRLVLFVLILPFIAAPSPAAAAVGSEAAGGDPVAGAAAAATLPRSAAESREG
jgi:O-antigen ligase